MKSQAGIEGMILFMIIGIILTFAIVTFGYRNVEVDTLKVSLEADKLCNLAKNSVNQVSANGPGSRNEMTMPDKLLALDYNVTVYAQNKRMILMWQDKVAICSLLTSNVTNSTHFIFQIKKGKNVFTNQGGVVVAS